jgi:hypothetical protein
MRHEFSVFLASSPLYICADSYVIYSKQQTRKSTAVFMFWHPRLTRAPGDHAALTGLGWWSSQAILNGFANPAAQVKGHLFSINSCPSWMRICSLAPGLRPNASRASLGITLWPRSASVMSMSIPFCGADFFLF